MATVTIALPAPYLLIGDPLPGRASHRRMLATGVLGGLLALLFWIGGSLLLPIVLHALLDLPPAWARNSIVTGDEA